jgi:uncharacterized protein (DUF1501 family)
MNSFALNSFTTRRNFLSRAAFSGLGLSAAGNIIRDFGLIQSAMAAQGPVSGYKAIVCLFLAGGNDANNWIVPTDTETYNAYATARGGLLQIPQASLLPLNVGGNPVADGDGHTYGLHPSNTKLQALFAEGKVASLLNIGSLVRPTTKTQYNGNPSFYRPPQLFSHSDQVTQWQTSIPDQPPTTGWCGRVADIINGVANPAGNISMSISLAGANTLQVGNMVAQYQVATTGAETLSGSLMTGNNARVKAMRDIMDLPNANLQRQAYAEVLDRAIATGDLLNTSITNTVNDTYWTTAFPTTSIGSQMKMIARLIEARGPSKFNMNRQIFFCQIGGFDTHTAQVRSNTGTDNVLATTGAHYSLLFQVSEAIFAFQRAMEQLGVSNDVTTFTASDFSRTFPNNSQGSDHGWGSHHFVVGGSVDGGKFYGKLPTLAINGPDDTGTGRWIPTLSVDQHAATLARWFGVDPSMMSALLPNLSRFSSSDLGFMG